MDFSFLKFGYAKIIEKQRNQLEKQINEAERFDPSFDTGLDDEIIKDRISKNLVNKKKKVVTKSYFKIVFDNFFPFFSILIYALAVMVLIAGIEYYSQLMFLGVILCNSLIGLIQDIRARRLVDKLSIVNKAQTTVVRNGQEIEINANDLVLDDVIFLKNGDQVPADCIVIKGKCAVNEAMLTGEPDAVRKKVDDEILSGTYISSGNCYARVNRIGACNKAEIIQAKAAAFNKPKSEILKSLNFLFKIIAIVVITLFTLSLVSYWHSYILQAETMEIKMDFWSWFVDPSEGHRYISGFVGSMVSMIPAGLFLLTSVTLSVGVLALARKRCLVQELYCIEMLARVDTLCLDKTGTITDGTMSVSDLIRVDKSYTNEKIKQIISSLLFATKDDNYTAKALVEKFSDEEVFMASKVLPFSSETKYSGCYLEKVGSVGLGAFGYIKIDNKTEVESIIKKYTTKGYRCMILTVSKGRIEKEKLPKTMTCIAVLLLEDHIRDDAPSTLNWFMENGVDIKVISGDDPMTVSEIAKKTGIKNFDKYINLEGKSIEEVKKLANDYTIFGRVSPEQKEALVVSMKESKKTVAMTGDGVNDILALKRADCSIAMASGSDAAKNISHLVLLDSNFSVLPSVVAEGRRVINNLQRTSSLFLSKTMFSVIVTFVSILAVFISRDINMQFPLSVSNFYIWEVAFIGVGGFFLALEPNANKLRGSFLSNAIRKALPVSIVISTIILSFYTIYMTNYFNHDLWLLGDPYIRYESVNGVWQILPDGEYNGMLSRSFQAMGAIAMAAIGGVSFIKVSQPFSKYRFFVVIGIILLTIICLTGAYLIPFVDENTNSTSFGGWYFAFEFTWLSLNDWLWLISFVCFGVIGYLGLDRVINKNSYLDKVERITQKQQRKEEITLFGGKKHEK